MVKNLRILLCVVFVTVSSVLSAQVNEVTLVASGEGQTKTDAVNNALRSAIEQAYGVFVSANTDILNDELVKDEIVTVSSGNIHSYKELGCVDLTDGNKSVSVEAVVSVSNLVNFAQSKGAACEFAGAVFGANLKLINLNKENAEKAMEHLYLTLENVGKTMYDYELEVGQPKANGEVDITVVAKANANYKVFTDLVYNTLKSLSVANVEQLESMGIKYYTSAVANPSFDNSVDIQKFRFAFDMNTVFDKIFTLFDERSMQRIVSIQDNAFFNFVLKDSNGMEYTYEINDWDADKKYRTRPIRNLPGMYYDTQSVNSSFTNRAIVQPWHNNPCINLSIMLFRLDYSMFKKTMGTSKLIFIPNLPVGQTVVRYTKTFNIPVEELMTISGFTIERKN